MKFCKEWMMIKLLYLEVKIYFKNYYRKLLGKYFYVIIYFIICYYNIFVCYKRFDKGNINKLRSN